MTVPDECAYILELVGDGGENQIIKFVRRGGVKGWKAR